MERCLDFAPFAVARFCVPLSFAEPSLCCNVAIALSAARRPPESVWNSGYFVLLGWLPTPGYGMLPLVNHSAVPSTVTPSRIPHATHRSAAVREVERWILGYVVPESAHETDKTSVSPEPAPRDWPLPELLPSRLTGAEPVIEDGRPVPGLTVLDF